MTQPPDVEEELETSQHWTPEILEATLPHPSEWALRADRLPHIWCPGCGTGTSVTCFVEAMKELDTDRDRLAVVSGIGCTGRVAGYIACDSFHTTHGRAIPFAVGLHMGNPELKVIVFSGDGDLTSIGGNHLIHAARRNVDITVFCVNNFTYGMTGGQAGPTTQEGAKTSTSPYGHVETPFNLPELVAAAGATYVARWTVLDLGRLRRSMVEAMTHPGFAFIEIISPCPVYYGRRNRLGEAVDELRYYKENTEVDNFAHLDQLDVQLGGEVKVGKFVDEQRPTFNYLLRERLAPKAQAASAARPSAGSVATAPAQPEPAGDAAGAAKATIQVRLGGFGGQGIILAGNILGRAATVYSGRNAVMSQSYGPESRGGACQTELVISDSEIAYPRVTNPDVVVAMSQETYRKYGVGRPENALLIIDEDLVTLDDEAERGRQVRKAPATRLAEGLGRRIAANIVMLGYLIGATGLLDAGAMREAVAASVPKGSQELNVKAFDLGFQHAGEVRP